MAQNVALPISVKINTYLLREKSCLKLRASLKIFEKLPKEINHPKDEYSPNLVTLATGNLNNVN
jgi:hypothetical protein